MIIENEDDFSIDYLKDELIESKNRRISWSDKFDRKSIISSYWYEEYLSFNFRDDFNIHQKFNENIINMMFFF
jgi:hypothetical protein